MRKVFGTLCGAVLITSAGGVAAQAPGEPSYRSPASMLMVLSSPGINGAPRTPGPVQRIGSFFDLDACKRALDTVATKTLGAEGASPDVRLICVETGFTVERPQPQGEAEPRRRRRRYR
jgi:hypothetical protein